MSSTSFFAELVKSKKNARKLQEKLTKDGDDGGPSSSSRENSRLNGGVAEDSNDATVITISDSVESTPTISNALASVGSGGTTITNNYAGLTLAGAATALSNNNSAGEISTTHHHNNQSVHSSSSTVVNGSANTSLPSSVTSHHHSVTHQSPAKSQHSIVNESKHSTTTSSVDIPKAAVTEAGTEGTTSATGNNASSSATTTTSSATGGALNSSTNTSKRLGSTSLTKLPLPPGINLEDIDSSSSPTNSPDPDKVYNNSKRLISITKDLPMPPGKSS